MTALKCIWNFIYFDRGYFENNLNEKIVDKKKLAFERKRKKQMYNVSGRVSKFWSP